MTEYQRRDIIVGAKRAERVLNVSEATIRGWIEAGMLESEDGGIRMSELERFMRESGMPSMQPPELARALSVLPRFTTTFTTSQVAELLGCSRDVVTRLADQGHLQSYRLQSNVRRITRLALACYLTDNPGAQAMSMGLVQPSEAGTSPKPRRKRRTKSATKRSPQAKLGDDT